MLRLFVVAAAFAAAATPALAQDGTAAQRIACTPDAIRLCHPGIADALDHTRVIACMKAKRAQLSKRCRAALAAH